MYGEILQNFEIDEKKILRKISKIRKKKKKIRFFAQEKDLLIKFITK